MEKVILDLWMVLNVYVMSFNGAVAFRLMLKVVN